MRRSRVLGLIAMVVAGSIESASAGLPCAAYSSAVMELQRVSGTGLPCGTCDVVWCPAGDYESVWIRVTVRDCLSSPVPSCAVRLDLSGRFDPNNDLGSPTSVNGRICGASSRMATTDSNGAASFDLWGGGAAKFALNWVLTALCADPEIELAARDDTLCIKSFDLNGSGNVNFSDTFKFAPQLNTGAGYSSDFRDCSSANRVNFRDSFLFAVHQSHFCPGGAGQSFTLLRDTSIGEDCDEDF
jgi:hypothetical protein